MTEAKAESDKCQKEQERRRKKYKFALVRWEETGGWEDYPRFAVEHKSILGHWWQSSYTILCDDQPYKVLKAMAILAKENEDEI